MTTPAQLKREVEILSKALSVNHKSTIDDRLAQLDYSDIEKAVLLKCYRAIKTPIEQRTGEQQQAIIEADERLDSN